MMCFRDNEQNMKGEKASLQGYSRDTVPVEPCTEADYISFKVESYAHTYGELNMDKCQQTNYHAYSIIKLNVSHRSTKLILTETEN